MFAVGFFLRGLLRDSERTELVNPLSGQFAQKPANPYPTYRFSALRGLVLQPGPLRIEKVLQNDPAFTSYLISWEVPELETGKEQRVTGQLNVPSGSGPFPVLILLRGYVEKNIYATGVGTRNAAVAFARNGYITIAPDFLGYGGSDPESTDMLLARFEKPVTVLQLLTNVERMTLQAANQAPSKDVFDPYRIGIWAHSNGGQIALSILEITSRVLPSALWAPVSQPFPYSALYYTNDLEDQGAYLRSQLYRFEFVLENDPRDFSILREPSRILAPIQIHQGTADDAVPASWSHNLARTLQAATVSAQLFIYPGADHNLQPAWSDAIQRDLQFFAKHLKER